MDSLSLSRVVMCTVLIVLEESQPAAALQMRGGMDEMMCVGEVWRAQHLSGQPAVV